MKSEPSLSNLWSKDFAKPPDDQNVLLQQLGAPHVDSFNFMINHGLNMAVSDIVPLEFEMPTGQRIKVAFESYEFQTCMVPMQTIGVTKHYVLPIECRQTKSTYKGRFSIRIAWWVDGVKQYSFDKDMGEIPIMLKVIWNSFNTFNAHDTYVKQCHLNVMKPKELVQSGEHEQEWGGYFVVKGLEKIIRMLIMTRRNYPITVKRSGWKLRGNLFSDVGVTIRCVKDDQTTTNNVLHFVSNGSAKLMFSHKKRLYYAPLVLIMKCLCDYNDQYINQKLVAGFEDDLYYNSCVQNMLRLVHDQNLHTHDECKSYLGKMFRVKFTELPQWYTDQQITDFMLENCLLIHLNKSEDKFNLLVFMAQKLFSFARDNCKLEGADCVMMQELLLGGHLYLQILKERLQNWLVNLKFTLLKRADRPKSSTDLQEMVAAAKVSGGLQNPMENFLTTGNITSPSGLGLLQDKGLVIIAENINRMRYMSHFKAIHRGAFFQQMRTTEARQLLPDAWGFICPVHTPDGAPCGLLNHLTMNCIVTDYPDKKKVENIPTILFDLGMLPVKSFDIDYKNSYCTQLDGRPIGYVHKDKIIELAKKLRLLKIKNEIVPKTLEICVVPIRKHSGQYPGLFLFTGSARMMRPLINLHANEIEYVGTFEQVYMDICIRPEEIYKGITTHMELSKTSFMSNLAQLIPMPDCNQSPRNMYQCQMGKQTMGSPCHNWDLQADTKLYRLQTPGTPLFRPVHYDNINLDDFAMGTNAIVAVISYTGYDMEDAMIINKSSDERGFGHGSIYKSEFLELGDVGSYFCKDPTLEHLNEFLDADGLPYVGRKMKIDEPYYSYYDSNQSDFVLKKFHGKEECYVNCVRRYSGLKSVMQLCCISFRVTRNSSVGDKFASRAGQKGICSQKWPSEDLPFTESGLVPDIVFNPHGFPSRMTIAMMIELMAGKSAAVHGLVHDATPFKFSEKDTAIDYFGRLLEAGGYNYYGTETMYSGIDGREMTAQIFFGVVHYQRLRHMVSDKWQVRSTGAIDEVTHQPVGGRKRGGGVRFGEMERDSLISHGASFLLQDRLFHCSDKTRARICTNCDSLLGPVTLVTRLADKPQFSETKDSCRFCGPKSDISEIQIPYIFKYFVTQLASCNINIKVKCKNV